MPNFEELDEYLLSHDKHRSNMPIDDPVIQKINQDVKSNISKQAFRTAKEGDNAFEEINNTNIFLNVPGNKAVKRSKN